jgi:hypothetical protein
MGSTGVIDREALSAAFDALDVAVDGVLALDLDAVSTRERLVFSERCERYGAGCRQSSIR